MFKIRLVRTNKINSVILCAEAPVLLEDQDFAAALGGSAPDTLPKKKKTAKSTPTPSE